MPGCLLHTISKDPLPSGQSVGLLTLPFPANTSRTDESYSSFIARLGGCTTREASATRVSIKLRKLSIALRNCFWKLTEGKTEPHHGRLIVFCDYDTTYNITKWFLECCGIDFAELANIQDYNDDECQVALLSSRNLNVKLTGEDVLCMDVVPSKVLYKISDAMVQAHIRVLVLGMNHDKVLAMIYYETKPCRGGSIECRWRPQSCTETEIEEVVRKAKEGERIDAGESRTPKQPSSWKDIYPMFVL